jgi:8-oxo-dGTP diphosphatase
MKVWVGLLVILNKQILMVREVGKNYFSLPGGSQEENESDLETIKREIFEELSTTEYEIEQLWGEYDLPDKETGDSKHFILYKGKLLNGFKKESDIEEVKYIESTYKNDNIKLGSITSLVLIPELKEKGLII